MKKGDLGRPFFVRLVIRLVSIQHPAYAAQY